MKVEMLLMSSYNVVSIVVFLTVITPHLARRIKKCCKTSKRKQAIEKLEREKEEAVGTEEECPICYTEFEEG